MHENVSTVTKNNLQFFNAWAKTYDLLFPLRIWFNYVQKTIIRMIPFNEKFSILDVGCGTGDALDFLKRAGFSKLYGIDLSPEMLKYAQKKLGHDSILRRANVEHIPFQDTTFDIVINTEAFHHFPKPQQALDEIYRVIKPDGSFYLADINFFVHGIHWLFKKLEPGHVKIYSKKEFRTLFRQAGFTEIVQRRVGIFVIITVGKKRN